MTQGNAERFDEVVICSHSDQALRMLRAPSEEETQYLSAIRYQDNVAVLHNDESVLPRKVAGRRSFENAMALDI
ncbi:MAG: hypothetical protein EBU34_07750, partial [Alphaproteobacteria bacterium]|nr:hypothetical protein [Alphaproteobacteria bacterium]